MVRGVNRPDGSQQLKKPDPRRSKHASSQPMLLTRTVPAPQGARATRSLLWSITFILVAITSATLGATLALVAPFWSAPAEEGERSLAELFRDNFQYGISSPTNVLVMGIDQVPEAKEDSQEVFAGRSDTMLLVRLDPDQQDIHVLSIPRDTQVEIPGLGVTKINHANWKGGPDLASQVVSQTLDVPIDRHVRISTDAFRELVDLVGGVRVFVPQRMSYEDQTQKLKIDLEPGWQTLNGDETEQFARFRSDQYGDVGRTQRQQVLLKALLKRLANPLVLPRLPKIFNVMQRHIDTNLTFGEMVSILQLALQAGQDEVKMVLLPGRFSQPGEYNASYWILDPPEVEQVMRNYFQTSAAEGQILEAAPIQSLKIAIQNASSEPQASHRMANYLAEQGIHNVYIDHDWPDTQRQTQVIVQRGDLEAARALQTALGKGSIEADSTGSLASDLTIRVGEDWVEAQDNPDQS